RPRRLARAGRAAHLRRRRSPRSRGAAAADAGAAAGRRGRDAPAALRGAHAGARAALPDYERAREGEPRVARARAGGRRRGVSRGRAGPGPGVPRPAPADAGRARPGRRRLSAPGGALAARVACIYTLGVATPERILATRGCLCLGARRTARLLRSEEHTSELQSRE